MLQSPSIAAGGSVANSLTPWAELFKCSAEVDLERLTMEEKDMRGRLASMLGLLFAMLGVAAIIPLGFMPMNEALHLA